jgi:hypothetical protein
MGYYLPGKRGAAVLSESQSFTPLHTRLLLRNQELSVKVITPMDPATIAGLTLGVIPLIISAVENYEVTFQPFVTYRRYSTEISMFATKLDTQKAIFYNQCQLILQVTDADGPDIALDHILKEPHHASRKMGPLSDHLEALLGGSLKTCVSIMQLVKSTLDKIVKETKGFHELRDKKVLHEFQPICPA